jgi:hypothetical protein
MMHQKPIRGSVRRFALLCVVAAGTWSFGPPVPASAGAPDKPPDRFTLPVTLRAQETELWCWAATGQMTMEFLGKPISQGEQADIVLGRHDCCGHPCPRACVRGGSIVLIPFGFTFDLSSQPPDEEELVRQLHTLRKPVPFFWQYPGGGGHAAVVVGYARQPDGAFLVECLDPWPPPGKDRRSWSGGQRIFMPYPRWARDYDHVFGGALVNVTRKP